MTRFPRPFAQNASRKSKGDILILTLIFASIAITVIIGLVNWGVALLANIRNLAAREQAFQIAEAGVDYYQWHLAQAPNDYEDGTGTPGPYVHNFYDKNGNLLGTYSLTITPPPTGSTIVKIVSVGQLASSTISRSVQETLAIPSLAKFAVVANDNMNFGSGTTVYGPIQSNKGIHFNGVAHNLISSALTTYTDPDTGLNEWAIYTTSGTPDPQPNTPVNNRPDVFMAGRQFPVPAFSFTSLTQSLSQLQGLAQNGGKEWTASGSGFYGYHMVFGVVNGQTEYTMYKVKAFQPATGNCGKDFTAQSQINFGGQANSGTNWGTWSIRGITGSTQNLTYETQVNGPNPDFSWPIPNNGLIFVDDNLWVDGTVSNARITVVSANIGATSANNYTNITVNTNLLYKTGDPSGSDVIGLIAQGNINSGMVSDNNYEIDAALVAVNGRVGRFYYNYNCSVGGTDYSTRNSLTLLGMIATAARYGFAYSDNTGYAVRNINYDGNLLYGPPPSFPSATTQYQVISWQQLL